MGTLLNYTDMAAQLYSISAVGIKSDTENLGNWYFFGSESEYPQVINNKLQFRKT